MNQETDIWSTCPLTDYAVPAEPTAEVVRKGLRSLWRRFRGKPENAPTEERELHRVESEAADRLCPAWNYDQAAAALESALGDWLEHGAGVRTVVGAPFSGTEVAVRKMSEKWQLQVLEAPPLDQLSNANADWLQTCDQALDQGRVVIPRLERCFLRHADGFDLLRALLQRLGSYSGRCLVHCQSWAWSYLEKPLCPESALGSPLTFAPMTWQRLRAWLLPALDRFDLGRLVLLRADNGNPLWRSDAPRAEQSAGLDELLHYVAGRSRGLAGVSREIWRECLRRGPSDSEVPDSLSASKNYVVWITPWNRLDLPTTPGWIERQELFVLNSLLIHGGLDAASLAEILSAPMSEVSRALLRLQHAGLAQPNQDEWSLACLAYPTVREHLKSEGFQMDGL